MMKKTLICLSLVACFVACSKSSRLEGNVSFSESEKNVKMSEVITDCSLIKLETKDENLVYDVTMMRIWNDRIYILDCFSSDKAVWAYDMKGKFVGKVGAFGQGPGEYVMPMSLVVDEENNRLLVMDVARNRLLYYDAESLECVKEMDIPFISNFVEYLGKDRLIWYVGSGCPNQGDFQKHIQITDMDLNVLDNFIPRMDFPRRGPYNVMSYFHRYADDTYFHHPFTEDFYVYEAESDTVLREYSLSLEGSRFPSMDYLKDNQADIVGKLRKDGYVQFHELLENDEKILCYFGKNDKPYIGVYDKKQGSGYYTMVEKMEDDLGLLKFTRPKTVYNGYFASAVYVEDWSLVTEESILYSFKEGATDEDNPLILLYR